MEKRIGWQFEFERQVKRLLEKSNRIWYKHPQPSLWKLLRTGKGNCVAWSNLAVMIAKKFKRKTCYVKIWDRHRKDVNSHQVSLIYDKDGTIWYQSGIYIEKLYKPRGKENFKTTAKRLCRKIAKSCKWKCGGIILDIWR